MTRSAPHRLGPRRLGVLAAAAALLAGCGSGAGPTATTGEGDVTVTNCGAEAAFPSPAQEIYVNDGNMIAMLLALGAQDQIAGVSSLQQDERVLSEVYGAKAVDRLPVTTTEYPTLENVIATQPDVMVAGWSYGYSTKDNLTPDALAARGIAPYVLSESCRQDGGARGTMPPWEALFTDLENLGEITGRQDRAREVVATTKERLEALEQAPRAREEPTVFLFDSGTKNVFTSGSFGAPQAVIEAAGGRNATEEIEDTWVEVSWEELVSARPNYFVFVDYPGQSYEQKVATLKSNPATRNLPAVREERFLNLPYAAWTSSPLNIDAAERLRKGLEEHGLVPRSDIQPRHDLVPPGTGH